MKKNNRTSNFGFTLLELMVVLLILALLASIVAPRVTKHMRKAKLDAARVQVVAISSAVESFAIDTGRLPTNEEGLTALVAKPGNLRGWDGPYITKKSSLTDPWGNPYQYKIPGRAGDFDVYSYGDDNKEGGDKEAGFDIGNWE
jgi:general secretion pathway protein G